MYYRTYTYNRRMFIRDSLRSYRASCYSGLNKLIIIRDSRRSYRAYSYSGLNRLIIIRDSRRSYRAYYHSGLILILRSLHLFRDTCRYHRDYGTYSGIAELILIRKNMQVLQNLYWYFVSYLYYEVYLGLTELILVFLSTYRYFESYPLCEGIRRYNKSELIIIVSYTRSDQTYTYTYMVWTLVHSRYRSEQMHILILQI